MAIRERLDSLSRGELAGLVVVLVATLAGVGLWYSRSLPKPIQVAETPAPVFASNGSVSGAPGGDGLAGRLGEPSGGSDRRCDRVGPPSWRLSVPAGFAGDRRRPARRGCARRRRPDAAQPRGAARRRPADLGAQGRHVRGRRRGWWHRDRWGRAR